MKKYFILISTTIAIIVLFKLLLPGPTNNKEMESSFWSNKTHSTNDFDIIACGDSRIYRGISSDILRNIKLDLSFLNLGYSSAGLSNEYLDFVVSKFNPESKKNILIVGISPHSLTKEAKKNVALKSYLKLSCFEVFRYRYLSSFLKEFAPYKPLKLIKQKKNNYLQTYNEDGWVASDNIKPDSTRALKSYKKIFNEYKVSQNDMLLTINKLKQLALSGINVIAFRVPTTVQMERLEDSISGYDESFVKNSLIQHSINYLDFQNSDFASYDGSHLNEKSARKLSEQIGEKIKELYLTTPKLH